MRHRAVPLVGRHPALDFVNSVQDWLVPAPRDYLVTVADALHLGARIGLLSRAEARRLAARAPAGELSSLRALRALLERLFRAVVTGTPPRAADLTALERRAAAAAAAACLVRDGRRVRRTIPATGAAVLRWRLIEAAVALLTSDQLHRLKTCPTCGWLFLDTSKNQSRRWCSMAMCGNTAKARAYYRRRQDR